MQNANTRLVNIALAGYIILEIIVIIYIAIWITKGY
jgi:hypothetical protein